MKKAERRKLKEQGIKPQRLDKAIRKYKEGSFKTKIPRQSYEVFEGYTFSYNCPKCQRKWYTDSPYGFDSFYLNCVECREKKVT